MNKEIIELIAYTGEYRSYNYLIIIKVTNIKPNENRKIKDEVIKLGFKFDRIYKNSFQASKELKSYDYIIKKLKLLGFYI